MKAGLLAIAALSAIASAQPHRRHQHVHEQRDVIVETAYETDIAYATVTAPAALVYVDQDGNVISQAASAPTSTAAAPVLNEDAFRPAGETNNGQGGYEGQHQAPTTSTTQAPAPTTTSSEQAPVYTSPAAPAPVEPTTTAAPAPESTTSTTAAAAQSTTVSSTGNSGYGITYSPYNKDTTCKSASQVQTDIDAIPSGYSLIRLYGTDCNQVANVYAAAKSKGFKLFLGMFDITSVASEVDTISKAMNGDWSSVDTIAVGNEGVNDGKYSVAAVAAAVVAAKALLVADGYTGPVVTVDTFVAIINNPALCLVGDYTAANCHAFFDGGVEADGAGGFVLSQAQRVSAACNNRKVVITESGWPTQGTANQKAVPSEANQQSAITSLKNSFSSNLILFNAFNDQYKANTADTFNAEQYWGMYGDHPSGA